MEKKSNEIEIVSNRAIRCLLIGAGTVFIGIGVIGIVLPILPTTPFLLLAAACYARGSKKFYRWLLTNKWFGNYIRNYREGRGIPLKVKGYTLLLLWGTILFSVFFVLNLLWVQIILILIAVGVSVHILMIKTYQKK